MTHVVLTSYWQLWPAAAAALVFVLSRRAPRLRKAGTSLALLLVAGAAALYVAFPVFTLPAPTGPHAVGTTSLQLIDASREEIFGDAPGGPRALALQIWYPAVEDPHAPHAPYAQNGRALGRELTGALGLPTFLLDHLARVREHARLDAPLPPGNGPLPVVLFSQGFAQGFVGQNTVQMQELASHGYVVVSIGRPYESALTLYPDGRAVTADRAHLTRVRERLAAPQSAWAKAVPAERDARYRALIESTRTWAQSVDIWARDLMSVLDELPRVSVERFAGRLDLDRVGALGMSFGGAATARACLLDARIDAGVNLDGVQLGDVLGHSLRQPFLFMYNGTPAAERMNQLVYEEASGPAWQATIAGSTHFNYTDLSLWSPLFRHIGLLGPIEGVRMTRIVNAYVLAFFDQHLRGVPQALLAGAAAEYPEVTLEARNRTPDRPAPRTGTLP